MRALFGSLLALLLITAPIVTATVVVPAEFSEVVAGSELIAYGRVTDVRLALGGVAHKPWRAEKAEAALRGGAATEQAFRDAAAAELADARPLRDNGFKIELATRTLVAVLGDLSGAAA